MGAFDVVVLGGGTAGVHVATEVVRGGKSVALVEAGLIGGESPYLACVPSNSLLLSASKGVAWEDAVARRNEVTGGLDDSGAAGRLAAAGVTVFRGTGVVTGPGEVSVASASASGPTSLTWDDLVIATGCEPVAPPIEGLSDIPTWTTAQALCSPDLPRRLLVLGGGSAGCELAQIFAAFGSQVTLIEADVGLLSGEAAFAGEILAAALRRALLRAVPEPEHPQAITLLDVSARSIRTFIGDAIAAIPEALPGFDLLVGLQIRDTLHGLCPDPDRWRLVDLRPPQKSRRINRAGRTLKITPELLIWGTTGIRRPLGDPDEVAQSLARGEAGKLARRLESDVKALYAFYCYGVLHHGVRLRWGFLDEILGVEAQPSTPQQFADRIAALRIHGGRQMYHHTELSINSRLDEKQAAILHVKLRHLEEWIEGRRAVAKRYTETLQAEPGVKVPLESTGQHHVYHQYTVRLQNRDEVEHRLRENGVQTKVYYPIPLHRQPVNLIYSSAVNSLPYTEAATREVLSLPMYPELPVEDQNRVIKAVREALRSFATA